MALNKNGLVLALKDAFNKKGGNSADEAANALADAIDAYVRTATVNTTVSGVCPSGVVTGSGVGSLS